MIMRYIKMGDVTISEENLDRVVENIAKVMVNETKQAYNNAISDCVTLILKYGSDVRKGHVFADLISGLRK
jgi:hypothetical protein